MSICPHCRTEHESSACPPKEEGGLSGSVLLSPTLDDQWKLVNRIKADLTKESKSLRRSGNEMGAVDCESQAAGMDEVLTTISTARRLQESLRLLLR